jgi:uncharacterized Zn finger protein (UPF0148 family)
VAVFQRNPKAGTFVTCPACHAEIPLLNKQQLPGEFSVQCPSCGLRKPYQSAEAHEPKQDAEAIKPSESRIQFSTKNTKSMPPKSWLNEWASWLQS